MDTPSTEIDAQVEAMIRQNYGANKVGFISGEVIERHSDDNFVSMIVRTETGHFEAKLGYYDSYVGQRVILGFADGRNVYFRNVDTGVEKFAAVNAGAGLFIFGYGSVALAGWLFMLWNDQVHWVMKLICAIVLAYWFYLGWYFVSRKNSKLQAAIDSRRAGQMPQAAAST